MKTHAPHTLQKSLGALLLTALIFLGTGCATKAPKVEAPVVAFVDTMTVPLEFSKAWELTRDVLLEQDGIELYTRDKRGLFVLYTDMHREKIIYPKRSMITITLKKTDTAKSTEIAVETVAQRYGVTLLTYPGWRDTEETSEEEVGQEILESLKSRIANN